MSGRTHTTAVTIYFIGCSEFRIEVKMGYIAKDYEKWTEYEKYKLKRLNEEGKTVKEIAKALHRSLRTTRNKMCQLKIKANREETIYGVYERAEDELIIVGNAEECAEYLGIKKNSFETMASRGGGIKREIVKIGKEVKQ